MAVTQLAVSGQQALIDLLDANAANIASTSFDAPSNTLTITLVSGDSLVIAVSASPNASAPQSLGEWYYNSGWPKRVIKDGVTTENQSVLEVAQAREIDQRTNGGKFKRYYMHSSEDRTCDDSCCHQHRRCY